MDRYAIITYDISKLEQKKKMQLIRKLQGYDTIKKGEVVKRQGALQELEGFKFGINTILIPQKNKEKIDLIFNEYRVGTKSLKIML